MTISVFGLGYVGVITSVCLCRDGHQVIGVDISQQKMDLISQGKSPFHEPGLAPLLNQVTSAGLITCMASAEEAVISSEVSLISVGTPSTLGGQPNLSHVEAVCRQIGRAIRKKDALHTVILRSTVVPGTTAACSRILSEEAGGVPVHVAFNPEFLREGSALSDYDNPPYTVIGATDPSAEAVVRGLYSGVDAPVVCLRPEEAELLKVASNGWHATKVVFANEIGRIAKSLSIDGRRVMQVLADDTKLNTSGEYLKPGFSYGGSCLPKEVRTLNWVGRERGIKIPLLSALPQSNDEHIQHALSLIRQADVTRVGLLGISFKAGTDDLRESPALILAARLREEGLEIRIWDPPVADSILIGANLQYANEVLPDLEDVLVQAEEQLCDFAELLAVTQNAEWVRTILEKTKGTPVIDLVGLCETYGESSDYDGICW